MACCSVLTLLLLLHLLGVKLKLFSFKNVAVALTGLAWTRRNASIDSTRVELICNLLVNHSVFASCSNLVGNLLGFLCFLSGFGALFNLLFVEFNIVMLKVPLSEGVRINNDDAILNNGLGSNKLVICCVVNDIKNSRLSRDGLRSPGEHSLLDFKSTPFKISSSGSNWSNSWSTQLGHGSWSTHLELSLLLVDWHTPTGRSSFVPRVSVNSHDPLFGVC